VRPAANKTRMERQAVLISACFKYLDDDAFELTINPLGDRHGTVEIARIYLREHSGG